MEVRITYVIVFGQIYLLKNTGLMYETNLFLNRWLLCFKCKVIN